MAAVSDVKYIGGASNNANFFSNEESWIKVRYEFAKDAGALSDLNLLVNGSSTKKYVITDFFAFVVVAPLSVGSAVFDLGVSAGGTELWSDKAVAALAIDTVHGKDTAAPLSLPASGVITFGIEGEVISVGTIDFYFKVKQIL